jgi:hypothetical protein
VGKKGRDGERAATAEELPSKQKNKSNVFTRSQTNPINRAVGRIGSFPLKESCELERPIKSPIHYSFRVSFSFFLCEM